MKFGWVNPREFDIKQIDKLVHGAGYKTVAATLSTSGTIVQKQVDGEKRAFLQLTETNQAFELAGEHAPGPANDITIRFLDWPKGLLPSVVVK